MQMLFLDGRSYATPLELHLALKRLLHLPDYYGCNADALHDCLANGTESLHLCILHPGSPEVASALRKCCRVVEELGGEVRQR